MVIKSHKTVHLFAQQFCSCTFALQTGNSRAFAPLNLPHYYANHPPHVLTMGMEPILVFVLTLERPILPMMMMLVILVRFVYGRMKNDMLTDGRAIKKNAGLADHSSLFFTGQSTVELGELAGHHKLSLELELVPFLNHQHGILIFASQDGNGSGDFVSVALIDGFVYIFQLAFYHIYTAWGFE